MGNFRSLTCGNGAWVATGNDGLVAYSPDGKSWAITPSGHGYNLRGPIPWRDRVIVVGGRGCVLVSADILHWEPFVEASFEEEVRRYPLSPGLPAQFFRITTKSF